MQCADSLKLRKVHAPKCGHVPNWIGNCARNLNHLQIAQNIFGYSLSIVAAIAVGHLNDPTILGAVVLAGSLYNVTGEGSSKRMKTTEAEREAERVAHAWRDKDGG